MVNIGFDAAPFRLHDALHFFDVCSGLLFLCRLVVLESKNEVPIVAMIFLFGKGCTEVARRRTLYHHAAPTNWRDGGEI